MKRALGFSYTFQRLLALGTAVAFLFAPALPLWAADAKPKKEKKTQVSTEAKPDYPRLLIGPGDLLSIFVYGENGVVAGGGGSSTLGALDQLPTDYQVDSDGQIMFPFLGRVKIGGMTPAQASDKIANLLSKPRKVTVLVKESSTYWVAVLGNVAHPGRYQIAGRPTLLSVLSLAGGPLIDADMGGAILIHDQAKTKIDLDKYLKDQGVQMADPYLYPGDVLTVPKSGWPSIGEWAIIASILASGAVIVTNIKH